MSHRQYDCPDCGASFDEHGHDCPLSVERAATIADTFRDWDGRETLPDQGATVTAPNYSPRRINGRTMVSPLARTLDYDARPLFTSDHAGEAIGYPTVDAQPSGATVEHALSDDAVRLGRHDTIVTRSRKGRTTFRVTGRGVARVVGSSDTSGLSGLSSIALARLADSILARHEGTLTRGRVQSRADIAGEHSRGYLVGTDAMAFEQMVRDDPSAVDVGRVAHHNGGMLAFVPRGIGARAITAPGFHVGRGATREVADDLARGVVRCDGWTFTDAVGDVSVRVHELKSWNVRVRLHGRVRASERRAGWARVEHASPPQYVRARADGVTECLGWHTDTDHAWYGHTLTARPVSARGRKRGVQVDTRTALARDPAVESVASAIDGALARVPRGTAVSVDLLINDAVLTVTAGTSGRVGCRVTRAGNLVASWQGRAVRAIATRALAQ